MKFFFKILVFIVIFTSVGHFCRKQTKGFSLHKITSKTLSLSQEKTPLDQQLQNQLETILEQPFYFFSRGGQCYVFLSGDGKTVLKFFKQHHIRFWHWFKTISLPTFFDPFREKLLKKHEHQSSPYLFQSCKIAYEELKEHTGLIYLHLNTTEIFKKKLTIYDNLKIAHQIDLDQTEFVLQKKAEPLRTRFKSLIKTDQIGEAKNCIDSILDLMKERYEKGVYDRDPNMHTNYGFIEGRAIEIDIGSYVKDLSLQEANAFQDKLVKRIKQLNRWLKKHSPELSLYLTEKMSGDKNRKNHGKINHD